jgi:hypothetical protein
VRVRSSIFKIFGEDAQARQWMELITPTTAKALAYYDHATWGKYAAITDSVNSYFTTTGMPVNTFRRTKPFSSKSFNSVDSTFTDKHQSIVVFHETFWLPSVNAEIILRFHLPPITYKASATELRAALQYAFLSTLQQVPLQN